MLTCDTSDRQFIVIHGFMTRLGLSPAELIIYALIYSFTHGAEGMFYGGRTYFSKLLSCSERSVIRYLNELVKKGYIKRHDKRKNAFVAAEVPQLGNTHTRYIDNEGFGCDAANKREPTSAEDADFESAPREAEYADSDGFFEERKSAADPVRVRRAVEEFYERYYRRKEEAMQKLLASRPGAYPSSAPQKDDPPPWQKSPPY